jgi:hypothetical protein
MAHDVFISHSTKDKIAADAVVAHLERAGIRCWVAPRDIMPGKSWASSIIQAINQCKVMVVVFSSNVNRSDHIGREVERAVSRGIGVIPLRIEDVLPQGDLEYFLSSSHWMDAITPPLERHIEKLALILRALLNLDPGTYPGASAQTVLHTPPPRAEPSNAADQRQLAKAVLSGIRDFAIVLMGYIHRSTSGLPNFLLRIRSELWPARSGIRNQESADSSQVDALPHESRTRTEGRGRRILRGVICLALGGPVVGALLWFVWGVFAPIVAGVLKCGADDNKLIYLILSFFYIIISILFTILVYSSWRRRPWAVASGAMAAFTLPLLAFAIAALLAAQEFGSPFSDHGVASALLIPLVAGLFCIPAFAFAVLAVMEHEPESAWFRSLWRPIVSCRPRWLIWLRNTFVAVSFLAVVAGVTHATVAELRRGTPLNDSEEKLMGGVVEDR